MSISIAHQQITVTDARRFLAEYPKGTVQWYDLARVEAVDGVTLADLGRLAVINADLTGNDAVALLEATDAPWGDVPFDAQLNDADPEAMGGLYDKASELYWYFRKLPNIGPAKASKLLHLKRPALYPILDQYVLRFYRSAAREAARLYPRRAARELYWAAIRQDLLASVPAVARLRDELRAQSDDHSRRLSELTDLRLLDICIWKLATGDR